MLDELWNEATLYGRPRLYQADNGQYAASITFHTIKHVELVARHAGYCNTADEALKAAIAKAKEIVESTVTMGEKLKHLLRIGSK